MIPKHARHLMGPMILPSSDRLGQKSTLAPASPLALSEEKIAIINLVRRADSGDPAAQSELVKRYTRRVTGFVRNIIRQPDAEEDVTQLIFIKMFRRLNRLRDPVVFESWLFTLARNTSLDFIRRRRCRPDTVGWDDAINQMADPATNDASAEILAALQAALTQLNSTDRNLVQQFVAGDSYNEIAARTGLSLATVKVRLHRVRPFLRTWVGQMTDTRQSGRTPARSATVTPNQPQRLIGPLAA